MRTKVNVRNAHIWTAAELAEREDELRREELGSKYCSLSRQQEIRFVRRLLRERTTLIDTR